MFRLSDKELSALRQKHRKILKSVEFPKGTNPARHWPALRSPLVQAMNYIVVSLCKCLPPCEAKNALYRLIGVHVGRNVSIANDCILDTIFPELIVIGDNVTVGWGTKLYTHEFGLTNCRIGSIVLDDGCMVGEWSVVRPGITVGRGSQIAAMSFVNKDIKPGLIEGGVPVHLIELKRHLNQRRHKQ